jgi:uncharacterized cupin superfamily protein
MSKIDVNAVFKRKGSTYPPPFNEMAKVRIKQGLGDAGGLSDFGVNLTQLPPGAWSSQRHWHSAEDEFVYILAGEVVLITDHDEEILCAGDCAAFPKNTPNGHHLINKSYASATYLEIGTRRPMEDVCHYSDIDMHLDRKQGGFMHKDGTPYKRP